MIKRVFGPAWDEYRLYLAELLFHPMLWLMPKGHPDSELLALMILAYGKKRLRDFKLKQAA